jgi:hypothetical protein
MRESKKEKVKVKKPREKKKKHLENRKEKKRPENWRTVKGNRNIDGNSKGG